MQTPRRQYVESLSAVVAQYRWIIEGVNASTLDLRLSRADLLIWLERGRLACPWRVACRIVKNYGRIRPDMAPGCVEKLPDLEFHTYIWTFETRIPPRIEAAIDKHGLRTRAVHLAIDRATAAWLSSVNSRNQSQH